MMQPTKLLRRTEAARYLSEKWGIPRSPKTLAKHAVIGGGPAFRRAGRIPLYDLKDLDDWAREVLSPPAVTTAQHDARKGKRSTECGGDQATV